MMGVPTGPPPSSPNAPNAPGRRTTLRLLVVADLAPGGEAGPLPVSGGAGTALAAISPALSLTVPNRLGSGPRDFEVSLHFTRLEDFHPDAIAARLPAAPPPAAPAAGAGNPLDSLLAQVDVPKLQGSSSIEAQVAEIVQSEPFRALEADWRGVDFLARRAAGHPAIQLEILAAPKEAFLDAFFDTVFPAEHEGSSEVPLSAVVLGYEFDRGPADVEALRHAARMGESLRVPFLASVGAPFWGLRQAKLLAGLPDLVRKLQGPEYAKWNGLRAEEASLWLCLAANRFLLRGGWPGGTDRPLWGSGAYALAAALIQGFAAGGVSFPLAGEPSRLADLPGEPAVEVPLADAKSLELARIGLAPLIAVRGETTAQFPSVPTLHAPKRYVKDEATRSAAVVATLPYQAFGGAAAHALQELARETGGGLTPEEVRQRFVEGLLAFLAGAEEAPTAEEVEVEVQPNTEDPGIWDVVARLRPRFQISGGEVDLVLGSVVPR
jgi:type VI secretion system protein ImpC